MLHHMGMKAQLSRVIDGSRDRYHVMRGTTVTHCAKETNLVLIADKANRAYLLRGLMRDAGITGVIRRMPPGRNAVHCVNRTGAYREKPLPDLFFYDFSDPEPMSTSILKKIAFGDGRSAVPIVVLTSPESQTELESGDIDGGDAIMFSPSGLTSFVSKMQAHSRQPFLKALRTLYEYGPILVSTPPEVLLQDERERAIPA